MTDLRQVENPAGRLDVAASRLLERLVAKASLPVLTLLYQGLRPDLDDLLHRHLGPGAIPTPDPQTLRVMFDAAIKMRQEAANRVRPD